MASVETEPRRRRTQEERRTATRGALLDATIDCLIEYGYGGVTTTRVVERAGVSRGAQVHHFPTKAVLVAEALRRLAARRAAENLQRVPKLPPSGRASRTRGVSRPCTAVADPRAPVPVAPDPRLPRRHARASLKRSAAPSIPPARNPTTPSSPR